MAENLPREVVAEDQRLDAEKRAATGALMRLRWHWTRNLDNPERVSAESYASDVGKAPSTIKADANGWQMKLDDHRRDVATMREDGEYRELAKVSETKRQAAQAIAEAEGIRVDNVLSHRRSDVRDLVNVAQDTAERRRTSVTEEIDRLAKQAVKDKQIDAKRKAEHKAKHTARWLSVEVKIGKAQRLLSDVLTETEGVEFIADERELMAEALGKLRAVLNLIDVRVVGTADIDWDAELAKMGDPK